MNRRTLLKRIGVSGLAVTGATTAAAASDVGTQACPICPGDICPEGCGACYELDPEECD